MLRRGVGGRWRRFAAVSVALYALVLALAPFEHHDLICHLTTPQHCVACASSSPSVHPHAPAIPGGLQLTDAGRAFAPVATADDALLVSVSSGRSPPALF